MTDYQHRRANQEYYDRREECHYDLPHAVELSRRSAKAFRRAYEFNENETMVMDFACGVGLLSRELIPHTKSIVGVDISQRMVDEYNLRAANQGLSSDEMRAIRADILSPLPCDLHRLMASFDVIVCAASYHHFHDIAAMTQALVTFLKPGGVLLVIDLLREEHFDIDELFPEHGDQGIVPHRGGFNETEIRTAFSSAGLTSEFDDAIKAKKKGHPVTLFIARGVKATEVTS